MKKVNIFILFFGVLLSSGVDAQSLFLGTKPDKTVQEGESFTVDVTAQDFEKVISCQFGVFWDPQVVSLDSVSNYNLPDVTSENLNQMYANEGRIRFNWVDPSPLFEGYSIPDDEAVFSIYFKAIGGPASSTMIEVAGDEAHPIFPIEFVNAEGVTLDVEIDPGVVTIDGVNSSKETITDDFTLFQNNPNPFRTSTNISFYLNQKENTQLSIFDHAGKVVFERSNTLTAGLHTIQVSRDLFTSAGSYFFTLKTENATATRQLVVQ